MLRVLFLLLLGGLAAAPGAARAQAHDGVHGGVKGGLNLATISNRLISSNGFGKNEARWSYHGGAYLTVWLGEHLAVQPELLYSDQGAKFTYQPYRGISTNNMVRMQIINVPVLLKIYPATKYFYLEAGPQFGLLLDATMEEVRSGNLGTTTVNVKRGFKRGDYAVAAGLGVEAGRLVVGIRGIYGLSDLHRHTYVGSQSSESIHHRVAQAFVGIRLF